mmetsp:Transcript_27409/g.56956  ORF Transcript_27409/g.56956 Transcript_27409/m.56956 type:complete len:213 (+) Transcript_27409:171-809(+)
MVGEDGGAVARDAAAARLPSGAEPHPDGGLCGQPDAKGGVSGRPQCSCRPRSGLAAAPTSAMDRRGGFGSSATARGGPAPAAPELGAAGLAAAAEQAPAALSRSRAGGGDAARKPPRGADCVVRVCQVLRLAAPQLRAPAFDRAAEAGPAGHRRQPAPRLRRTARAASAVGGLGGRQRVRVRGLPGAPLAEDGPPPLALRPLPLVPPPLDAE